jgi:hypothetical protein
LVTVAGIIDATMHVERTGIMNATIKRILPGPGLSENDTVRARAVSTARSAVILNDPTWVSAREKNRRIREYQQLVASGKQLFN